MSVPDNRQHATDVVNTTCIEPRSFLTKCTISAFPFRRKHGNSAFSVAASFESNHAPNTTVNITRKYLLEGYKVNANMEIILVIYVNEQLKINLLG